MSVVTYPMLLFFLATFLICELIRYLTFYRRSDSEYCKPRISSRELIRGFTVFSLTTNLKKFLLICIFPLQNPDIVMLNFRNLSYENDTGNEDHLQNGVTNNGVAQSGVTQNSVTQNGMIQNGAINNIHKSLHKQDAQISNGAIGEHNPPDQTFLSRDYPHVQEPPFNRLNRCRWRCKITANAIDAWSRVLFPLAYGLFIVAYWIIYSENGRQS